MPAHLSSSAFLLTCCRLPAIIPEEVIRRGVGYQKIPARTFVPFEKVLYLLAQEIEEGGCSAFPTH